MGYLKRIGPKRYRYAHEGPKIDGKRQQITGTFYDLTKTEAEAELAKLEAQARNGEHVSNPNLTFKELFSEIIDNYATHKHANVKAWLDQHPRFQFHFTPTSSSWLNMVERFFADIASRRIRRGSFRSVNELIRAIMGYIKDHNRNPKRFVWTKRASTVIRRVNRSKAIYGTGH